MPGKSDQDSTAATATPSSSDSPPFRFYDNRQKYLAFVNTCNEKATVARRAAQELSQLRPQPPALRIFDAGMGDATVLSRLMGSAHRDFPTVPLLAVAKEISLEDVRLGLEKMPDRFYEHPHTVLVITNLSYMEAPQLTPRDGSAAAGLAHAAPDGHVRRTNTSSRSKRSGPVLAQGWQTQAEPQDRQPDGRAPVGRW